MYSKAWYCCPRRYAITSVHSLYKEWTVIKRKMHTNYKLQTTAQTTAQTIMCFRIPFLDFFSKNKTILGDDDGSTSPMLTEGRCTYLRLSHISYYIARMCAQ
jgi:hypothetical protein